MENLGIIFLAVVFLIIALLVIQWSLKKVGLGTLLPGIGITIFGLAVFLVWKRLRKKKP